MKINATDRALLQEQAATVLKGFKPFRETVTRLVKAGATREELDSILTAGKIPAGSEPYHIISRILTVDNNEKGKVGASGGGGGNAEQKENKEKSSNAGKKAANANKDKPFKARVTASGFAMIKANFDARLEKATPEQLADESWMTKQLALACASLKDSQNELRNAANGKLEKPKAKSNAKKLVKANKMPAANGKRNAKPELVK